MANLIKSKTVVLDRRTSKNPSIDLGDFVTCCNCGRTLYKQVKLISYFLTGQVLDWEISKTNLKTIMNNPMKRKIPILVERQTA